MTVDPSKRIQAVGRPEKIDTFVSVVMILQRFDSAIEATLEDMHELLSARFEDHEIVLLTNPLEAGQVEAIDAFLRKLSGIRFLMVSSPIAREVALAAGMEQAIGDFIVLMNPWNDPAAIVPQIVEKCRGGCDIVFGLADNTQRSLAYRIGVPLPRLLVRRMLGYQIPENASGLLCISRRAANAVMRTGRFHQTFEARLARSGYVMTAFHYHACGDESERRKRLLAVMRRSVRALVFDSTLPLRWTSAIGLLGSSASFAFALYTIIVCLVKKDVVEGWTSLVLIISFLFLLVFLILALFGEYMGRMLTEISGHSHYNVVFEKHSSVMLNANRLNVLHDSDDDGRNRVQTGRDR